MQNRYAVRRICEFLMRNIIFLNLLIELFRSHSLSMPFVGLFGRMLRVSYLFLNMLFQLHQMYLRLPILRGSWYDAIFIQLLLLSLGYLSFIDVNIRSLLQSYIDGVHGHKLQFDHANYSWLCLDLLDVLCQLAERGHATSVRSMLEYPIKHCPEVLLLGMAQINVVFFTIFLLFQFIH